MSGGLANGRENEHEHERENENEKGIYSSEGFEVVFSSMDLFYNIEYGKWEMNTNKSPSSKDWSQYSHNTSLTLITFEVILQEPRAFSVFTKRTT